MASNPLCPRCHSPMTLLAEEDGNWQFGCERCKIAHVLTKPSFKMRAKVESGRSREQIWRDQIRLMQSKPKIFDFGGCK